jgi:hypothetical protein
LGERWQKTAVAARASLNPFSEIDSPEIGSLIEKFHTQIPPVRPLGSLPDDLRIYFLPRPQIGYAKTLLQVDVLGAYEQTSEHVNYPSETRFKMM